MIFFPGGIFIPHWSWMNSLSRVNSCAVMGFASLIMKTFVCHTCSSRAGALSRVPLFSVHTKG